MEETIITMLKGVQLNMQGDYVGEEKSEEWLNIRIEIGRFCTSLKEQSLENLYSDEKWRDNIQKMNEIRKRVTDLQVSKFFQNQVTNVLDKCVEMMEDKIPNTSFTGIEELEDSDIQLINKTLDDIKPHVMPFITAIKAAIAVPETAHTNDNKRHILIAIKLVVETWIYNLDKKNEVRIEDASTASRSFDALLRNLNDLSV